VERLGGQLHREEHHLLLQSLVDCCFDFYTLDAPW